MKIKQILFKYKLIQLDEKMNFKGKYEFRKII